MKTTTYLIVAIEHEKPLPEKDQAVSDVVSDRVYGWLHNRGVKCSVRATRVSLPLDQWEEESEA